MKRPIFYKIFAGYLLITLLLSALTLTLSFRALRSFYIASLSDDLGRLGTALASRITPLVKKNDYREMDSFLKNLDISIHRRITVVDPAGKVLADSERDPVLMENHRDRPEIATALGGRTGTALRQSTTFGEVLLYVALPLPDSAGVIRLSMPVKDINILLGRLKLSITRLTLLVILLSLIIAFLFARSLSLPIVKLNAAAQRVAGGDLSARVHIHGNDELRDLADSFNHMTVQLQSSFAGISRQKEELNAIISSMKESLFVIDKDEKVVLSNPSFKVIAGNQKAEGRYFWEVLRDAKLRDLLNQAKNAPTSILGEIERESKTYLCSITRLDSRQGYVVLMHDITQIRNLEKIKKDFVGNVSHELRTPLTAIKGYVETLEGSVKGEAAHYIEIIKRHTDRLIHIVQDLLILSEMEEKGFSIEMGNVDMKELLETLVPIFAPRLKESGLSFELNLEPGLPPVRGDRFKLEQAFINLIDNAIKYTEKGRVTISAGVRNHSLIIDIADTGIGIPQDHLSRVFERFYVVDKSRSRKSGGTGLGLAIVKHIVLLHHGSIDVISENGSGTTFRITLPASHPAA